MARYDFRFAPAYRLAALPFGVTPHTAYVDVDARELRVRYGLWTLRTTLTNVRSAEVTGPFTFLKTAGPPHLSFADRGVSFATNGEAGVCVQFHTPVPGIDPTKRIQHPGATLTVEDLDGFLAALDRRSG